MGTFTASHVGWSTMQRGRDCDETARTCNPHATFRVYLLHPEVRSMSEAFRMYLLHSNKDLSCSGPARARNVAPFRMHLLYLNSVPNDGGRAVEGSEEHFDESEHVDDLAEEERSTDGEDGFGEEVDKTRESEGEGCRSPEGSDFAAEEGYEEDDSNAEEGHEGVWGEVQEALSSMGNEDYDETALCARSQASRSSSSS